MKKDTDILDEYPALPGLHELTAQEKKEQQSSNREYTTQMLKDQVISC